MYIICTKCLDLRKNWISRIAKIEGDFMYGISRLAEKLKIQNCVNSTGNCVHYIDGLSGFEDKLNIQNCVN